jgi:hypothetical protein
VITYNIDPIFVDSLLPELQELERETYASVQKYFEQRDSSVDLETLVPRQVRQILPQIRERLIGQRKKLTKVIRD